MVDRSHRAEPPHDLEEVLRRFRISGSLLEARRHGCGHIHDTYCAVFEHDQRLSRYVLQRINRHVFEDPLLVMENIRRVTEHVKRKVGTQPDADRRVLRLVSTVDGATSYRDEHGDYWRSYGFIENTHACQTVTSTRQAYEVARAFGQFQWALSDLAPPRLHETIVAFHDTPKRFEALERAVAADACGRVKHTPVEIEFALRRRSMTRELVDAELPERVTHNDTKLNNVLFDNASHEALCVIDLDTVMPGLAAYDFGDLVRSCTSPVEEDDPDLSKVTMQFALFEALVRGYLDAADRFLSRAERACLALAGKLITFEQGLRFLTDFLSGDAYFKIARPLHNLDRCRNQFKLVESIEQQEGRMARLVETVA